MRYEKPFILSMIAILGLMTVTAIAGTATTDKNQVDFIKAMDTKNITTSKTAEPILVSSCIQAGAIMIQTDKFVMITAKDNTADMGITEKNCKTLMKDIKETKPTVK